MSWYEPTYANSLGQKQDLHYYFNFHDSKSQTEGSQTLKGKEKNTETTAKTQNKTNIKNKTKQKRASIKKQEKSAKKPRK